LFPEQARLPDLNRCTLLDAQTRALSLWTALANFDGHAMKSMVITSYV
jgi:hypothetical protein